MKRGRDRRTTNASLRTALLLAVLTACTLFATRARSAPPADTLPWRIVHGRPTFATESGVTCYLWSEGGRLHLRLLPNGTRRRVRGELRTSKAGFFRDVTPSSEDVLVKQSKPSKIAFETHTGAKEDGFDVTLAGDFRQLTIDLEIDERRDPEAVRIGARSVKPRGLPARIDVKGADPSWIERFGF